MPKFTKEMLEELSNKLSTMDGDLYHDAVDELKEAFPAMAEELDRLWSLEENLEEAKLLARKQQRQIDLELINDMLSKNLKRARGNRGEALEWSLKNVEDIWKA